MHHKVHLGITGLRRTGKTVFLTSLVYQLTERGSKDLDRFANNGVRLKSGRSMLPKDRAVEPFPYSEYLDGLRQDPPRFPRATDREAGCILEFDYENTNASGKLDSAKHWIGLGKSHGTITLHLHDYPGEHLLDVGLLKMRYVQWSNTTLERMRKQCQEQAEQYLQTAKSVRAQTPAEILPVLRRAYAHYALTARNAGMEFIQPAMALLRWHNRHEGGGNADIPGPEELPFVPLPDAYSFPTPLIAQMCAQYNDYVENRVRPFVKRLQRCRMQLVLVDVLRVLRNGADAYNDTRACIAEVLRAYHDTWRPFGGIRQVLFAATKADHATKNYRANISRLLDDIVWKATGAIKNGIPTLSSEWFTSCRATQDAIQMRDARPLDVLHGFRKGETCVDNYYPGMVPAAWPNDDKWVLGNEMFDFPEFEPRRLPGKKDDAVLPHMNLDRVIWKVLEDCFR